MTLVGMENALQDFGHVGLLSCFFFAAFMKKPMKDYITAVVTIKC